MACATEALALNVCAKMQAECCKSALQELLCPRPQRSCSPPKARPTPQHGQASCSRLTTSLQSHQRSSNAAEKELSSILQARPPEVATTFLGVSPPMRSGWGGAANPVSHDSSWAYSAYNASHTSLQALRELDSAGVSFLRQGGDWRLLLGSPDPRGLVEEASTAAAMELSSSAPKDKPQEPKALQGFTCRAQYFAVR